MVDILLPTYNGKRYLGVQLDSILGQTWQDFRIIIRDDGSTDGTVGIIREYALKHPSRILFLEGGGHLGVNAAFNELMKSSSAPYIMFCDQDDVWLPDKVEVSLRSIKEMEGERDGDGTAGGGRSRNAPRPCLAHSDLKVADEGLGVVSESFFRHARINPDKNSLNRLLAQNTVTGCAAIINRSLLDIALPVPAGVYFYDYYLALVARLFGSIRTIRRPLVLYRQHAANVVGSGGSPFSRIKNIKKIREKMKNVELHFSQAAALYEKFGEAMEENDRKNVLRFTGLPAESPIRKIITVFKCRFFKQGFLRSAAFIFLLEIIP